ncbi:MAG: lipopolysaccharide biosynthesis protein [Acidobacteriota bacterium]
MLFSLQSSDSSRRSRRIASASLTALFGKGTALAVSAATIPLTVRYLGAAGYGLWITIVGATTMFFSLDIGIATTLTNLISEAYAANDREKAADYFVTAFWIVWGIVAVLGLLGWGVWSAIDWVSLFHVEGAGLERETPAAVAAAFIVFLLALPTSLAQRVLGGYQELHKANLFTAGGSLLSLAAVVAVVTFHGSLVLLVGTYAGAAVVANAACMVWVVGFSKPWMKPWPSRIHLHLARRIFQSGFQFFAIQLAGIVVFSSDNLIISHFLSPARVTPYAVTWRLATYITAAQSLLSPSIWPAYSEAYAARHLDWIRSTYRWLRRVTLITVGVGGAIMLVAGREIIRIWAGPAAVPGQPLIVLMCVWIGIFAFATNQACLMGATFRVGKQALSSTIAAAVNLLLSILWVRSMGPFGVLLATVVSYLVFVVLVQAYEVHRILRGDFLPAKEGAPSISALPVAKENDVI